MTLKHDCVFYTNNYSKSAFSLILLSEVKDLSLESSAEVVRSGLIQIFGSIDFRMKGVTKIEFPESSILMVGNVEKNQFIKITHDETVADLKKRIDELVPLGNSLVFRGDGFNGKGVTISGSTTVRSGDIIIVPIRTTFGSGENFHYMGNKVNPK